MIKGIEGDKGLSIRNGGTMKASDLEEITGESEMNIGHSLREVGKLGLAELVEKKLRIREAGKQVTAQLPPLQIPSTVTTTVTPRDTSRETPQATGTVVPPQALETYMT